jgi:hypothetical protein
MSGGELKSIGRELAVEALIDMHDRGPAYRVGKIMVSSRSYLIFCA